MSKFPSDCYLVFKVMTFIPCMVFVHYLSLYKKVLVYKLPYHVRTTYNVDYVCK